MEDYIARMCHESALHEEAVWTEWSQDLEDAILGRGIDGFEEFDGFVELWGCTDGDYWKVLSSGDGALRPT